MTSTGTTNRVTEVAPALVELRQYLLRYGRRDELIELFDRELVETQEACGMRVVAQFRDVDHAQAFVWMRAFANPADREASLAGFYGGPVWSRFGRDAAATMIDSDNVLQLRAHQRYQRPLEILATGQRGLAADPGVAFIAIAHRRAGSEPVYDDLIVPAFDRLAAASGLEPRGVYESDPTPNPFPALPVRRANCVVWIGTGENIATLDRAVETLSALRGELDDRAAELRLDEVQLEVLRLLPTVRSSLIATDR